MESLGINLSTVYVHNMYECVDRAARMCMACHGHLLPRGAPLSTLAIKGGQRRKVWHDIICKRKCAQVDQGRRKIIAYKTRKLY